MDGRQAYPKALGSTQREALPADRPTFHNFRMVGSHEHDLLVAEGHYRCPHCRRADIMEISGTGISRR